MKPRTPIHNRANYVSRTDYARQVIDSAEQRVAAVRSDADRSERRQAALCQCCYYFNSSRIGAAACTTSLCGSCERELHFGNTCIDVLCVDCAKDRGCCKHCGGDLNMKFRRKLNF